MKHHPGRLWKRQVSQIGNHSWQAMRLRAQYFIEGAPGHVRSAVHGPHHFQLGMSENLSRQPLADQSESELDHSDLFAQIRTPRKT